MRKFLLLIPTVLFFTACSYQDCHIVNIAKSDNITAEEALSHYNTHCADKYTRANIDERLPFILGDAEWLWDKAQASSYEDRSAIDIPLNGGYQYVVYRKQADGTYYGVHTLSRVVAVQDDASGNISFYIRVSIPDKDDINTSTESLNFGDKTNFSGLEYYITINGCPAAMVKFENGEQTDCVFLGDESIDKVARIRKFAELLDGLCIGKSSKNTRANDDMQYGQPYETFIDPFGSIYVYQDVYPKDGKADSVTQIFDDDIAFTLHFGGTNCGGNNTSGSSFGGVGNAGSSISGLGGMSSGSSGGTGGGSGGGSGSTQPVGDNNQSKDKEDSFYDVSINLDFDGSIPVNPIKKITLDPILVKNGVINLPTEPLTPSEVKSLILERLSPTNLLAEFIKSSDISIYPSSETNRAVNTLIADYKSQAIYYDNYYYNYLLSNAGRLLAIFHEFVHFYINSDNHQLMIDCLEYQQGLRDLFPDMPEYFYNLIQYAGCDKLFRNIAIALNMDNNTYKAAKKYITDFLKN